MSLRNVSVMGEGSIAGGSYEKVSIMGDGEIIGEVEAEKLSVMGNLIAENGIRTGTLSISGDGKFAEVRADYISIMGNGQFKGPVNAQTISVAGNMQVEGSLKAKAAAIRGTIDAKHAEFESFRCKGTFVMDTLNADDIRVSLSWNCSANEIGGESVHVKYARYKKIFFDILDIVLFRKSKRAELKADVIEADRIYLENTVANSVKGNEIVIGPGCKIKSIEYKNKVFIDKKAIVEHCVQG